MLFEIEAVTFSVIQNQLRCYHSHTVFIVSIDLKKKKKVLVVQTVNKSREQGIPLFHATEFRYDSFLLEYPIDIAQWVKLIF